MGLFWRRNRFVVWLLRGCAENWVKRRPPQQSNNTVRINLGPVARANRLFARWRHFTTTTRILQGFSLLCKLRLLLFKPRLDYQILIWKKSEKDSGRSSKVTPSCNWPLHAGNCSQLCVRLINTIFWVPFLTYKAVLKLKKNLRIMCSVKIRKMP